MPLAYVVSDEVAPRGPSVPDGVDLLLAAGDLPFEYLERLAAGSGLPAVFVPGNHDPDLSGFRWRHGIALRAGMPDRWPGPRGWVNADVAVVEAAGLRIAGLGGSIRYTGGPNQWTQRQQARRARRLARKAHGRAVDVLLTHSPPAGVGDRDDPPHRGFACLHDTVRRLRPRWLLHGHVHVHPHEERVGEVRIGMTRVRNVVGAHVIELAGAHSASQT